MSLFHCSKIVAPLSIEQEKHELIIEIFSGLKQGARHEKLHNEGVNLYAARSSREERIIYTHEGTVIYIIGILPHHNYGDVGRIYNVFLKEQAAQELTEIKFIIEDIPVVSHRLRSQGHQASGEVIFLSEEQSDLIQQVDKTLTDKVSPVFINGIAGSGKTTIAEYLLAKLSHESSTILYLCPNERLVQEMQERLAEIDHTRVAFKSLATLLREQGYVSEEESLLSSADSSYFAQWFDQTLADKVHPYASYLKGFKSKEHKLLDQLGALRAGVPCDDTTLQRVHESYRTYCQGRQQRPLETIAWRPAQEPSYDYLIVDETQLLSFPALTYLQTLSTHPLILFGDYNQGPRHFSSAGLTTVFPNLYTLCLTSNHRCSADIVAVANTILKIQRLEVGGRFETQALAQLIAAKESRRKPAYYSALEQVSFTAETLRQTLFVTRGDDHEHLLRAAFGTGIAVLNPEEISGLEFHHVVSFGVLAPLNIAEETLQALSAGEDKSYRPKDKVWGGAQEAASLPLLRMFFLIATRAATTLTFIEPQQARLFATLRAMDLCAILAQAVSNQHPSVRIEQAALAVVSQLLLNDASFAKGLELLLHQVPASRQATVKNKMTQLHGTERYRQCQESALEALIQSVTLTPDMPDKSIAELTIPKNTKIIPQPLAPEEVIPRTVSCKAARFKSALRLTPKGLPEPFYTFAAKLGIKDKQGNRVIQPLAIKGCLFEHFALDQPKVDKANKAPRGKGKTAAPAKLYKKIGLQAYTFEQYRTMEAKSITPEIRAAEWQALSQCVRHAIILIQGQDIQVLNKDTRHYPPLVLEENASGHYIPLTLPHEKRAQELVAYAQQNLSVQDVLAIQYNLEHHAVPGDGHCFYHAVIKAAGLILDVPTLRHQVADYVANSDVLKESIAGDKAAYIAGIRQEAWGDELEIKAVMSLLQRPVVVFKPDSTGLLTSAVYNEGFDRPPILLNYNGINHYDYCSISGSQEPILALLTGENAKQQRALSDALNPQQMALIKTKKENKQAAQKTPGELTVHSQPRAVKLHARNADVFEARAKAHHQMLAEWAKHNFNGNKTTNLHMPLALIAAENGQHQVIAELARRKVDLNQTRADGATLVIIAAINGHHQVIAELASHGVDLNRATKNGTTPAITAAENGHHQVIAELATHKVDLNQSRADGATLAIIAATNGHHQVIAELASHGVDLNRATKNGTTPAITAAEYGHHQVIAELARRKVDLNQTRADGATLAIIAAANGHHQVIAELANRGVDLNHATQDGTTPTFMAATHGHHQVIAELATRKVDLNQPRKDGVTPTFMAATYGHHQVIGRTCKSWR